MNDSSVARHSGRPDAGHSDHNEEYAKAHDTMEAMSRVACALIFQSARDLVCDQRVLQDAASRAQKAIRRARRRTEEIRRWIRTVYPLDLTSLTGTVWQINLFQDHRGGRRIDCEVVRSILLKSPNLLAVVDGPAEFRILEAITSAEAAGHAQIRDIQDALAERPIVAPQSN